MKTKLLRLCRVALAVVLQPSLLAAQAGTRWLPDRALLPTLFAGARDPVTKAELLLIPRSPDRFGEGVATEYALGAALPILSIGGSGSHDVLVGGVEAAVFGRFTLEVIQREIVSSDWLFAVPIVWRRGNHWLRLRYFHVSSHLGDEYARRFAVKGVNFARDAAELMAYVRASGAAAVHVGARWAYNVHPEWSKRWTVRAGAQLGDPAGTGMFIPFGSVDLEAEQDTRWEPRLNAQAGVWLPPVGGRRALRAGVGFLTGPSPLGQFQGLTTTQLTVGLSLDP